MRDKPLLFVDIDGVISLFGFAPNERPEGTWRLVDGVAHLLSSAAARHLRDLDELFDFVWCSGWEEKANDELPHALGLGPWPYLPLDSPGGTRAGSSVRAHWKLDAVDGYAAGRPLAWIDDAFNAAVEDWAAARSVPTLLVHTDPPTGLTAAHAAELRAFASGLTRASPAGPAGATQRMPPGSRLPKLVQGVLAVQFQNATLARHHRRHGDVFTVNLPVLGRTVVVGDPELVRQVLREDPAVLHAGSHSPLKAVLGHHSLLTLDEERHLSQRRLLLPPFHGRRMELYEAIVEEETRTEIAGWPRGRPLRTLEPFMRITLNAIVRAVFGAQDEDSRALRRVLPAVVARGSRMATLTALQHDLGRASPWGRFLRARAEFDRIVERLIARAKADPALEERTDVLALLVQARHEDGAPMRNAEIADQLLTLLAAGHETTAATLAWTVERLTRHPELLARLTEAGGAEGKALREATIREVQRTRPTITGVGRSTQEPYALGPWLLPPGTVIVLAAQLLHDDPRSYEHPERFDPERFLGRAPDTYRWVPFGGGIRRCIGAAFAQMELEVVLRTLLRELTFAPTTEADERWRFRGVAFAPRRGGLATVTQR